MAALYGWNPNLDIKEDEMKGFKTIGYGVSIMLLAVFASPDVQAFVMEHFKAVGSFMGLGVIILRAITDSSIFKSTSPAKPKP